MKVIRFEFGFWNWLKCVLFHRAFYIQDGKQNWYCDACRHNALDALQKARKK